MQGLALRLVGRRLFVGSAAAAVSATAAYAFLVEQDGAQCVASSQGGHIVMSGDCGGTNTRLQLFVVPEGTKAVPGHRPPGELVFSKKYMNHAFKSFEEVCKEFLAEAKPLTGGASPETCCLAVAGGITDNAVEFTNVAAAGWKIDGDGLRDALDVKTVKLINDFEVRDGVEWTWTCVGERGGLYGWWPWAWWLWPWPWVQTEGVGWVGLVGQHRTIWRGLAVGWLCLGLHCVWVGCGWV